MARPEASDFRRSIRTRRIEGVALGALATLPIVPYLTFVGPGVERYQLFGELARVEQAARHVGRLETWLGGYSEAGWHHPGPIFSLFAAPIEAIYGRSSAGIYVAACLVNALSVAVTVFCARYFARRAHAIAAMLGVLAWFVAFGNAAANPTSAAVAVLPLMGCLVTAALFARNRSTSATPAIPMVVLGAIAAETNVATLPTVALAITAATAAFAVGVHRRGQLRPEERWRIAVALAVLLVLAAPSLLEQATAETGGNIGRLWAYFVSRRPSPASELSIATQHWTTTTALMPLRVVHRALADDGAIPAMLGAAEMPHGVTPTARAIAFAHVVGATVAAVVASRRGDLGSLALLGFGVLGDVVSVITLRFGVGITTREAVFWLTASSTVTWVGIGSTFAMAAGALADAAPRFTRIVVPTLIVLDLTAAVSATSLQRYWLGRHPIAPSSHPELANELKALEGFLEERLARDGTVLSLVVHRTGSRDVADAFVLELEKDGAPLAFDAEGRDAYAGGNRRIATDAENDVENGPKALHLYPATTSQPPPIARCAEPLARAGALALYGSTDGKACPDAR